MSTHYTIVFQNDHGENGKYGVFTAPPIVNSGPEVYSNVWMSYKVAKDGNFQIKTSTDFYAWVGTAPDTVAPGTVVSTGDSALATLGTKTQDGSTFPMVVDGDSVSLAQDQETYLAPLSAFAISTGKDFTIPNTRYLLGIGKLGKDGYVVPTACVLADTSMTTDFTPVVKFYIAKSAYQASTVVEFSSFSKDSAVIDFSSDRAKGMFMAIVVHLNDGTFTVDYKDATSAPAVLVNKAARNKVLVPVPDKEKLNQLQGQLQSLYSLLESFGVGCNKPALGNPILAWIGKIGYPRTTTLTAAINGATAVALAMTAKGYSCIHTETTNPDGSKSSVFKITPKKSQNFLGGGITSDWNAACAADSTGDGSKNFGIHPETSKKPELKGNGLANDTQRAIECGN